MKATPKLTRALLIIVGSVALFTIIGFFVLPPILRAQLEKRLSTQLGRQVTLEKARLNPYALSVTLENFAIQEQDLSKVFVGWRRLYVNFDALASLGGDWVLREISLDGLQGRLERRADLSLSIADLVARLTPAPAAPEEKQSESRPLRVEQLRVTDSKFDFTDESRGQPFTTTLGPVTFSLSEFRTAGARGAPHHFEAITEAGEKIAWSGTFQAEPLRSSGKVSIDDVPLAKYAPYYADQINGSVTAGTVSVQGRYEFTLAPGGAPTLVVQEGGVRLRGLTVLERGEHPPVVELPSLDVTGIHADMTARKVNVDQVAVGGFQLQVRREADGGLNLLALLPVPPAGTPPPAGPPEPALPLDVSVREIAIKDTRIDILDNAAPHPTRLAVSNVQASLRDVSLAEGALMPVEFTAAWAPQGTVRVAGNVTLSPLRANLQTAMEGIDLRPLGAYLEQFAAARLTSGLVTALLDVEAGSTGNAPLVGTAKGDVRIADFGLVDAAQNEPLVGFGALALSGLSVTSGAAPVIELQELALTAPYARVVVSADQSLNINTAFNPAGARAETPAAPPSSDVTTVPVAEVPAAATEHTAAPSTAPAISIGRIVIADGDYRFTDRSLEPAVNLTLNQFGGTVTGLSSVGEGQAEVDLKAMIDGAGLVSINGRLDPLRAKKAMDLKIDFKNVDLVPLSSYSGKYAGYELARGKLLLDLKVALDGPKIDAANVLTLNQFTFGSPVKSEAATTLPVRLGVALLKDRAGNIVIDLPVQGNTDDPEFRIGKVVTRVIVNLLTKAATSPFSLLGAAFGGGGDELSYQDFAPGTAELLPAETQKLQALIKALADRPALNLALEGAYDAEADRYALKRHKLAEQVRRQIWQTRQAADPNVPPPEQLVISPEEHAAMIKRLYDEKFPPGTEFGSPLAPPPPEVAPPPPPAPWFKRAFSTITLQTRREQREQREAQEKNERLAAEHAAAAQAALAAGKPLDEMSGRLAEAIEISDDDLRALAQARSRQVRDALVAGGTGAERLFLTKEQTEAASPREGARVFLTLQ